MTVVHCWKDGFSMEVFWFSPAFTGFYWVLLGFTREGLLIVTGFTGFFWVLLGVIRFYWVLLGFTGFYWVLPASIGSYLGLPSFYEFPSLLSALWRVFIVLFREWLQKQGGRRRLQWPWTDGIVGGDGVGSVGVETLPSSGRLRLDRILYRVSPSQCVLSSGTFRHLRFVR